MANQTINGLSSTTVAASDDFIPIWKTSLGITRKISAANLLAGHLLSDDVIDSDTYTPEFSGSSGIPTIVHATQTGVWKKISDMVHCSFSLACTSTSGGAGDLVVKLPFVCKADGFVWTGTVLQTGLNGTSGEATIFTISNSQYARIRKDAVNYTLAMLGAGDSVQGSIIYRATY